jgi:hypothetical protein
VAETGLLNMAACQEPLLGCATDLMNYMTKGAIIGAAASKAGVIHFAAEGGMIEEVGNRPSAAGTAARAGRRFPRPTIRLFGLEGTVDFKASSLQANRPTSLPYSFLMDLDCISTPPRPA